MDAPVPRPSICGAIWTMRIRLWIDETTLAGWQESQRTGRRGASRTYSEGRFTTRQSRAPGNLDRWLAPPASTGLVLRSDVDVVINHL